MYAYSLYSLEEAAMDEDDKRAEDVDVGLSPTKGIEVVAGETTVMVDGIG